MIDLSNDQILRRLRHDALAFKGGAHMVFYMMGAVWKGNLARFVW